MRDPVADGSPSPRVLSLRLRMLGSALALVLGVAEGVHVTRNLRAVPPPPPLLPDDGAAGVRFGLDEATRRAIFTELAIGEPAAREQARVHFPEPWSAEDDRAAFERDTAREIARSHAVNLTQIYLVLDEGIREHWPAPPNQTPLEPHTVPLKPRRN